MGSDSYVRDKSGKVTHIRSTSDNGKTSWLYEVNKGIMGGKGSCVEVADHHDDGTTTAYEHEEGFLADLFHGGRGAKK